MAAFETYTLDGCKVEYFYDEDDSPPWEDCDGHGPVRVCHPAHRKAPGERILHQDGSTVWLYDWQQATKIARQDAWNAPPYDAPNPVERAVQADFNYLQAYLRQDWYYIGITVTLGDKQESLWGVEYDYPLVYVKEIVRDMVNGLKAQAKVEADEAFYWACRGMVTV